MFETSQQWFKEQWSNQCIRIEKKIDSLAPLRWKCFLIVTKAIIKSRWPWRMKTRLHFTQKSDDDGCDIEEDIAEEERPQKTRYEVCVIYNCVSVSGMGWWSRCCRIRL
ncbi:hypothetical protein Hdeb2414_s0025g00658561 [Helianthus debilis subsp. tardiflorus]